MTKMSVYDIRGFVGETFCDPKNHKTRESKILSNN